MATVPKWQEPLVERAAAADERLRTAMLTAGGGQGALRAIVWGHRELAEVAHLLADRQSSPLVAQLLRHGARALKTQADGYEHAVLNFADQVDDEPVWSTLDYSDDETDDGQAVVEPTPAPAETSDDAPATAAADESAQASLVDAQALTAGTRVEIVAGVLLGRTGTVADPPGVEEYAGEQPGERVWVETDGGDRVSPRVADLKVIATSVGDRWRSALDLIDVKVDAVRTDAAYFDARRDSGSMHARQAALDAIAGIDQCVSTLHKLRAELAAGLATADAAHGGGAS